MCQLFFHVDRPGVNRDISHKTKNETILAAFGRSPQWSPWKPRRRPKPALVDLIPGRSSAAIILKKLRPPWRNSRKTKLRLKPSLESAARIQGGLHEVFSGTEISESRPREGDQHQLFIHCHTRRAKSPGHGGRRRDIWTREQAVDVFFRRCAKSSDVLHRCTFLF